MLVSSSSVSLILTMLWALAQVGQPPVASTAVSARIDGSVVEAGATNARSVPAATVTIVDESPPGATATTTSDDRGRFAFEQLQPGRYTVQVARQGYVTWGYGAFDVDEPGTPVRADVGTHTTLVIALPRQTAISGVIRTARGDAAAGTRVSALRRVRATGSLITAGEAITDNRGYYRLYNLPPGDYGIVATERHSGSSMVLWTWFPGELSEARATLIRTVSGEEREQVDFALKPPGTGRVTGRITSSDGSVAGGLGVRLERDGRLIQQVFSQPSGHFAATDVSSGRYIVSVVNGDVSTTSRAPRQAITATSWAEASVDVAEGAEIDLTLRLTAATNISGRLVSDDVDQREGVGLPTPMLTRVDRKTLPIHATRAGTSFEMSGVVPGAYRVDLFPAGSNWWVKSLTLRGSKRSVGSLIVDPSAGDVAGFVITVSRERGDVVGTLVSNDGASSTARWVVLVSSDRDFWHLESPKVARVRPDTKGGFVARGLPVGEYWLGLMHDGNGVRWPAPDLLDEVARLGVKIAVQSGTVTKQDLRVVERF